jgi:hypothetical protein
VRKEINMGDEPAFPTSEVVLDPENPHDVPVKYPGMSLRDYFAGQFAASIPIRSWEDVGGKTPPNVFDLWAEACYAASDALLRAREKKL